MAANSLEVIYAGKSSSPLSKSRFVSEFVELIEEAVDVSTLQISQELADFLEGNRFDLIAISDDSIALGIAKSSLALGTKLRSLPVQKEQGLKLIGSKSGLIELAESIDLKIPNSMIATTPSELKGIAETLGPDFIYKGEFSGGGNQVRLMSSNHPKVDVFPPKSWYPLVAQEIVQGDLINVDAFFLDGKLKAWCYSKTVKMTTKFGPSSRRKYLNPPSLDFLATLDSLGLETGLNGFLNSSWIIEKGDTVHRLIEADPRPNAWHQFFPLLGISFEDVLVSHDSNLQFRQKLLPESGLTFSLYPRELLAGLRTFRLQWSLRWLFRRPGTWEVRNRKDASVNSFEDKDVILFPVHWLISGLSKLWQASPKPLQEFLVKTGVRRFVLRGFGL
jgi:hypothetical protein